MNDAPGLKRILILDDDSDFRKLLLLRLGKMFANVELVEYDPIASGVPDENFDWSRFDVLLLDYYLCIHGVTGLDILQRNRKNSQFPATIMLTGAGNEEIAVHALKSGVSDYIRKEKLDKEALRKSILNAYEEGRKNQQRVNEATLHGHAFNKGLFYQQLEQPSKDASRRILLLIQLDAHEQVQARAGIIVRDNIIRHIAKQSFEVFQLGECQPSITRFSEISIALLIDGPAAREMLDFNLQGLCTHLAKRPYKFDGRKYRFTVSIGVVAVAANHDSAEAITTHAKYAVASAARKSGENSYEIYSEQQAVAAAAEDQQAETPTGQTQGHSEQVNIAVDEAANEVSVQPADEHITETGASLTNVGEESTALSTEGPDAAVIEPPADTTTVEAEAGREASATTTAKPTAVKTESTSAQKKSAIETPLATEKKKSRARESDEIILDDALLDMAALEVKRAFEEKRIVQTFQPVISLLATEEENALELYKTSFQLIDSDGSTVSAREILSRVEDIPAFLKYIDRWLLREAIGRAIHSSHDRYVFLMKISDASLADATLFNWLRDLLSGLEKSHPGRTIALEISADSFSCRQKQAEALMTYLRKSHGFKFMLAHMEDVETMKKLTQKTNFDLLKVSAEMIKQLSEEASGNAEEGGSLLSSLKARGAGIVVQDVEDATTLTEVISIGADYALGEFIGEPGSQLDEMNNVESFEIS